jgi:hypothetical protein
MPPGVVGYRGHTCVTVPFTVGQLKLIALQSTLHPFVTDWLMLTEPLRASKNALLSPSTICPMVIEPFVELMYALEPWSIF